MPKHDPDLHEVAKALAVDVRTVRRWRDLDDYPRERPVPEQVEWAKAKGLGIHKKSTRELAELKVLIAEQELEKKTRENQKAKGEIIEVAEAVAAARKATAMWQMSLKAKLESEVPSRVQGKTVAEIRAEMTMVYDELNSELQRMLTNDVNAA